MNYPLSEKYNTPELMTKIMGPNPMKLEEELMSGHRLPAGSVVCDLGSGQGLTSVFLAKEYGFTVYAADLWSDPEENRRLFREMGLSDAELIPVKADANAILSFSSGVNSFRSFLEKFPSFTPRASAICHSFTPALAAALRTSMFFCILYLLKNVVDSS